MAVPQVQRDEASAEFFAAAAKEQLLIKRCTQCDAYGPPRQKSCRHCGGDMTWFAASGEATLVTWTATPPSKPEEPPRPFGYVELAEGPWLETMLIDMPPDSLRESAPLRVVFLHRADSETIPAFSCTRPDAAAG